MDTYLKIADSIADIYGKAPMVFLLSFAAINLITLLLYYADKQKAKKHLWRIPEATLIAFAFIGGSFGAFAAMRIFHHKTRHPKFYILVPIFMILHSALILSVIVGSVR